MSRNIHFLSRAIHFMKCTTCLGKSLTHLGAMSAAMLLASCAIEPPLHLHEDIDVDLPQIDLDIDVFWDYHITYDYEIYNWEDYWIYGWDDVDYYQFGPIGYSEPNTFNIRRYYTGWTPKAPHSSAPYRDQVKGNTFTGEYKFGYYDLLIWNEPGETDGAQNVHIEEVGYDYVRAFTNPTMYPTQHHSPRFSNALNQPEDLFTAYDQGIEIPDPGTDYSEHGFVWDAIRDRWVKTLNTILEPVTYIYLTQIVLVNNKGRITDIDGNANLTGMAYDVNLNTRITGRDAVAVYYKTRLKKNATHGLKLNGTFPNSNATYIGRKNDLGETLSTTYIDEPVDVIGGKVVTFGICDLDPGSFNSRSPQSHAESVRRISELDIAPHYIEITMQFFNGESRTYSFDVTEQVRNLYKGGVITVVIDVSQLPYPDPPGPNNGGFDAEVKEWEQEEHEFNM